MSSGDDFCTQNFWATEAAFLAVLFTFNRLSLYQQSATPDARDCQPATRRAAVLLRGTILGRSGHQAVLHLSAARGGLTSHKPRLEAIFRQPNSTPTKLRPRTELNPQAA